ncbi:MAG: phospho-N-acetylmuramoyl-pentapeptide-transferase [Clostridiales bacterium]|nr:phospho-N-acetylmuramoyl-pentapeptide-transferase [Clostridiales bacterium]
MDYSQIIILMIIGLISSTLFTWLIIPILKKMHTGQNIREEGPDSHQAKSGTPTMGGIALIAATVVTCLVANVMSTELLIILAAFVLFGLLGFFDDYLKVVKKQNLGLRAWQKLVFQIAIGVFLAIYQSSTSVFGTNVTIPILNQSWDFGIWYVPFIAFVIVAMVNGVNLTDGLDGLATGVTSIVALFFAIVGTMFHLTEGANFCAALVGACLGFLIFNKNPAKVFMGDTGSLALGGGLAAAVIVMNKELLLPIVGFIYVAEVLSVIIQVISFKTTGKRVFKMAPLHHHFELSGMSERQVVVMFWAATLVFCIIGLQFI